MQVQVKVNGTSLPGSPVAVEVTANVACAGASIPDVLAEPFAECSQLSAVSGVPFTVDVRMRDCWGNPTQLATGQVQISMLTNPNCRLWPFDVARDKYCKQ